MRTCLFCVLLLALSSCSALAVKSACAQGAKCGQLAAGVTEESCVSAWTAELDRLKSLDRTGCTRLATATQRFFACRGALSCSESADIPSSTCAQENEDFLVASSAAALECN